MRSPCATPPHEGDRRTLVLLVSRIPRAATALSLSHASAVYMPTLWPGTCAVCTRRPAWMTSHRLLQLVTTSGACVQETLLASPSPRSTLVVAPYLSGCVDAVCWLQVFVYFESPKGMWLHSIRYMLYGGQVIYTTMPFWHLFNCVPLLFPFFWVCLLGATAIWSGYEITSQYHTQARLTRGLTYPSFHPWLM